MIRYPKKEYFCFICEWSTKASLKIWRDNFFTRGYDQIFLFYSNSYSRIDNDAYNESLVCEEDSEKQLELKMNFSAFGRQEKSLTPREVAGGIWIQHLEPSLRN